jgi:hypothetical protein
MRTTSWGQPLRSAARNGLACRLALVASLAGAALIGAIQAGAGPAAAASESPLSGSLLATPSAAPANAPAAATSSPLGGSLLGGPAPSGPAAPSSSLIFTPGAPPPGAPGSAATTADLRHYLEIANKLYKATSSDAATFQQAIGNPQLRGKLQQTLKIPLTDDKLRTMAAHASAEAAYWAAYRQGIVAKIASAPATPAQPGEKAAPEQPAVPALSPFEVGTYVPSRAGQIEAATQPTPSPGLFPIGDVKPLPYVLDQPLPLLGVGTLPQRPAPLLELGNGFLATGPLSQGFTLPWGAVWQPRLWVFGTLRSAMQDFYNGKEHFAEWANRLDLFANLQLSGTERLVVGLQPLNYDASGLFSGYRFAPGPHGPVDEVNANVRTLFFEGDFGSTLPDLDRLGILPIDFGYTVGRQPLFYQNGTLINDNVTMVGLARNSIHVPYTSNVLLDLIYAWDHVERPNRPSTTGEQPSLVGLSSSIDSLHTTYDFQLLHIDDARLFGDTWYVGGSAIQRFWLINTALRVNSSIADGPATAVSTNGTLVSLETSFNPYRSDDIVYLNPYVALGNFTQAAKDPIVPGPLGGLGISFAAYGIGTSISPLNSAADNVAGFTTGYQAFWDAHRRSLTLEIGVRENTGSNGTFNAQDIAARFQQAIGQRVLLEVDATYTRQEDHNDAFGLRTEFDYQF